MDPVSTVPSRTVGLPVRGLRLEVIEGTDVGKTLAGAERVSVGTATGNDLVLSDPTVSRYHLELSGGGNGIGLKDLGSTNGTRVGAVLVERAVVPPGTVLAIGKSRIKVDDGETVTVELHAGDTLCGFRGETPQVRRLMASIEKAARSDGAVLVLGESGSGKELVARALHDSGLRRDGPFVILDCAALSPSLVSSELFGHERGAFTGADRRHAGAFECAHGGTLFIDEIGELPASVQPALLGALDRRRFRRVGGKDEIDVDVRIVSATHRDLRDEVNRGGFRLDLYYRIAVVLLQVPPLRDRRDDIPLLVEHFLRDAGHDGPVESLFPADAMEALLRHPWPGNVRELRNVVESAIALGEMTGPEKITAPAASSSPPVDGLSNPIESRLALDYRSARAELLDEFERRYLARLLAGAKGNVSLAARQGRINRSHLIELLRKHQLK